MTFQPTLSDSEDQKMERMVNRARITTAAQFYDRDEKEEMMEIGAGEQNGRGPDNMLTVQGQH